MTRNEKLQELIQECANSGTGSCVLITGPHGSGKTFLVNSTVQLFSSRFTVVNFPGALARHSLSNNPSKELLKLMLREVLGNEKQKKLAKSVESLEDFFEVWPLPAASKRTNSIILVIEDIDLVVGSISQQSLLYTIFEAASSKPFIVIGSTRRIVNSRRLILGFLGALGEAGKVSNWIQRYKFRSSVF
jgi:Cdc6-like AAA superfamily ATPase